MKKIAIALLTIISIFTISCEIGLGASVDTEPPALTIQTPQVDSIIRDDFAISGTWTDDGTIKSVSVSLTRTDGKGTSREIEGTFDVDSRKGGSGTWLVKVPAKSSGITDGTYQAVVSIKDSTDRTTTQNTTFTIDNTPPVIVLQRPGTDANTTSADTYGQLFTLEGLGADDSNIDHIDIDIFDENNVWKHKVTLNNVPPSISMNVAQYGDDDYRAIYGDILPADFVAKNYYCTIDSYDGAQRYPVDGSQQTADDKKGNHTKVFYIYKDISKDILSNTKVTELYHMLSGSYSLGSNRSAGDISSIKDKLSKKAKGMGAFILDPKNNPTFSVAGKMPLTTGDCLDDGQLQTQYSITNGSDITLQVSVGLDDSPLVYNSTDKIEVYFQECVYNSVSGKYEPKAGASKIYPVIDEESKVKSIGANYQITVDVKSTGEFKAGSGKLEVGKKYLINVDGEDENGQPILPANSGYGFILTSNVSAPILKDITPETSTIYVKKGDGLTITGITKLTEGNPSVTLRWAEEPDAVWVGPVELTSSDWVVSASSGNNIEDEYSFTLEIPASKFDEKSSFASKEFSLEIRSENSGKTSSAYKTVYYDYDPPEIKEVTVTPEIDVSAKGASYPGKDKTVLNGEISVKASIEDKFTSVTGWKYEVWQKNESGIDTRITESELQTGARVQFSYDTASNLTNAKDAEIKIFAYDKAGNEKTYTINCYIDQSTDKPAFEAQDGITWTTGILNPFYINKSHDNLFTGNIYSKLLDDDGVKYVKFEVKPVKANPDLTGTDTNENDKTFVGYVDDTSRTLDSQFREAKYTFTNIKKEDSYTHNMPAKSGFYLITQTVYDKNFIATGVDSDGNPFPSDDDETNASNINYFARETYLIKIKGTGAQYSLKANTSYVSPNNRANVITVDITMDDGEAPYQFYLNNKLLDGTNGTNAPVLKSAADPVVYTHTFTVNDIYKDTGDIIAEYKITDANDPSGTGKSIKFQRDDNYPSYKNVKIEANSDDYSVYKPRNEDVYFVNNKEQIFTISGLASDNTSAVDRVYLEAVNVDSDGVVIAATPKIEKDNTTGYFDNISFTNNGTPWTGGAQVKIWVVDIAGNSTKGRANAEVVLNIKFDSTSPTAEHEIDKNMKDLVFRIGDYSNEAGTISDVGGKYFNETYGNATSIMIRGNFHDEEGGSGIDKYYYWVSENEVTIKETLTLAEDGEIYPTDKDYLIGTNNSLKDNSGKIFFKSEKVLIDYVLNHKTDTFSPLTNPEFRDVEYTKTDGTKDVKKNVKTNFKPTIKGFEEGSNYLVLVAQDNVGNKKLDSATVGGVTYPCYSLNVDLVTPTITTDQTGLVYTNVDVSSTEESEKFEISGTVSDKPKKTNGSSGIKQILLKSDKSEEFIIIKPSDLTVDGLTEEEQEVDSTLRTWKKDIKSILPASGQAVISATVTDNIGFDKTETITVFVDITPPTVIINSHNVNDKTAKTLTLKGTVTDINGSGIDTNKPVNVYFTTKTGTTQVPASEPAANADASAGWKKYGPATLKTNGTEWTCGIDFSAEAFKDLIKEGENTTVYFTVSAVDKADTANSSGNTGYAEVLPLVIDRKGPVHNKTASGVGDKLGDAVEGTNAWFIGSSLAIAGSFSDVNGTGVSQIKYQVGTGDIKTVVPDEGSYSTNASGFTSGTNTLKVWAVDTAGNESEKTEYSVKVDNNPPVITPINITDVKLTNGNTSITKQFYVTEPTTESGILGNSAIVLKVGSHDVTPAEGADNSQITMEDVEGEPGKHLVTITIGKNDLSEVNGYQTILATVTDIAGKTSAPASVCIVNKDVDPPSVSFTSPEENSSVNKTITVTGKIIDSSSIEKISLVATCGSNSILYAYLAQNPNAFDEDKDYKINDFVVYESNTYKCTTAHPKGSWNEAHFTKAECSVTWDSSTWNVSIDTTELDSSFNTDGNSATLSIEATDEAGNTSLAKTQDITINQHGDRPVITIGSDVDFTKDNNNEIWVNGSSTINGYVTDDDGIESFKIYRKKIGPDSNHVDSDYVDANATISGGSWHIALKELNDGQNKGDGSYILKFEVKDKGGTTFTSAEFTSGTTISDEDILNTPVIQDESDHKLGFAKNDYPDTLVPICLDTSAPTLVIEAISYDKSSWVEDYNRSDFYLGGKKDKFYVKVRASDTSGLADTDPVTASFSGKMELPGEEENQTIIYNLLCPEDSCTVENIKDSQNNATDEYIITVTNFKYSNKQNGTDADKLDFSGTLTLNITVTDKAGQPTDKPLSRTIDNSAPTIRISAPDSVSSTAVVSGSIEGEVVNPKIYFAVTSNTTQPTETSNEWKQDKFASLSYNIYFDGTTSDTTTRTDLFRQYLVTTGVTTSEAINNNSFTDLTPLYVWIKAEDVCGNISYDKATVVVDPQGNRPNVTVTYPETSGVKLGGTIRLMGLANDNVEAKFVWIKLDTNNDGKWNMADYNKLKGATHSGYTFGQISTNKKLGTEEGEVNITPSESNIDDIAIMVKVTGGSWNQNINADGELIPANETNNTVKMWVSATDDDNNNGSLILESSVVARNFIVDKDNPYFVQDSLKLINDSGAEQAYKEGMSVKGEWWLVGTIKDDVPGIRTISIKEEGSDSDTPYITTSGQEITTGNYQFTKVANGSYWNYNFKIKVGATSGTGERSFRITATEDKDSNALPAYKDFIIRYDNLPPTFASHTSESFKIASTVKNSQGYYSLSSAAYEEHDGDTGVDRIAVYFTRTIGDTTYIFDPMYKRTVAASKLETVSGDATGIKQDSAAGGDMLYWGSAEVDTISASTITLKADAPSYAHVGGLAKIKGVIYRITSVSGNTVVLSGEPGSDTSVSFAVASVVDNTTAESKGTANSAYDSATGFGYGYCSDYIYDDYDMIMENLHKDDSKSWTWELYVNSKNIPDGDVDIHYVIFDKAGNCRHDVLENASVENNKPRLVSVQLGLDKNQNGAISDDEQTLYYPEGLTEKPVLYTNAVSEINISRITVKSMMTVTPEIVGGNGDLYYQWKTKKTTDWQKVQGEGNQLMSGNDEYDDADFNNANDYVTNDVLVTQTGIIEHDIDWFITNSTDNDTNFNINYEIYDSTEGKTVFTDTNKVSINITGINLQVRDKVAPTVVIDDFYWNSLTDNSVYTSKTAAQIKSVADLECHIELHGDLPTDKFNATAGATDAEFDADDKVSGKIKLKGTVSDNIVLTDLYLLIDGMTGLSTSTKVATYDKTNGKWKNAAGTADFAKVGVLGTNGYEFDIDTDSNEFDIDNGHSVNWTLVWDTATISNVAQNNIKVQVVAYDNASAAGNNSNRSTTATRQVDVVPYITKIDTGLNGAYSSKPSVFNRSANGAYSVRRGESITIWGYNLKKGTTAPTVTIPVTSATTITPTASSKTSITVAIPDTAKSGEIGVTVNDVQTLNNKTAKSITTGEGDEAVTRIIEYNQEPNGINNDILTDVRKLSVWSFVDIVKDQGVRYPTMRVGKDTNQYVGFIFGSGADKIKMYRNKDLTKNAEFQIGHSWTQYYSTGVAVDNAGRIYGSSQNGDSGVSGQSQGGVGAGNYANNQFFAWNTTEGDIFAYSSGTNGTAIENAYNGSKFNSERIKNQKITVTSGTTATSTGNVYMVYYDDSNSQIKFRYGTVSNNEGNPKFSTALNNHNNTNNGTTPGYQIIAGPESMGANKIDGETDEQDGSANTSRAGEYAAVGVIPSTVATGNGTAVVAWYDASSQRLLFSYNTAPTETNNASKRQWGTNTKVIDPDFAGWYVDMVVDPEGGIHIAYYGASNGDLKYAYLPNYSSAPQICTVDSYLSVGTNISIEVPTAKETVYKADGTTTTRYVPRISYFMSAFTKTKYSVRTAYLYKLGEGDVIANGVSEDKFTGNWEVMTVPTDQIPLDYTIGVGIKKNDSNTNATLLGYGTKSGLQTAALQ